MRGSRMESFGRLSITDPILTHVEERDIDLLLVEEFFANRSFFEWFSGRISLGPIDEYEVKHSLYREEKRGQTDIGLNLYTKGENGEPYQTGVVLIENKVFAPFTDRQPERYAEECRRILESGELKTAVSVLVCPAAYARGLRELKYFDHHVSYEDIVGFLSGARANDDKTTLRYQYRSFMLEQAINRYRRGYNLVVNEAVTDFYGEYAEICRRNFPQLVMKEKASSKNGRPAGSMTVYFNVDKTLEQHPFMPTVTMQHHLRRSNVKIVIRGWGKYFDFLSKQAEADLQGTPYYMFKTGQSVCVAIDVPDVSNKMPVSDQVGAVEECLNSAMALSEWYAENEQILKGWIQLLPNV